VRNGAAAFAAILAGKLLRPLVGIVPAHFRVPATRRAIRIGQTHEEVRLDRSLRP
jgi:hypothetical protein